MAIPRALECRRLTFASPYVFLVEADAPETAKTSRGDFTGEPFTTKARVSAASLLFVTTTLSRPLDR